MLLAAMNTEEGDSLRRLAFGHNPAIHTFHTRLCRRSKSRKVVHVSTIRKLFLILNVVV